MTTEQFAYWLQGFVEMNGGKYPTEEQWDMIKEHLSLVFEKVTKTEIDEESPNKIETNKKNLQKPDWPDSFFQMPGDYSLGPIC